MKSFAKQSLGWLNQAVKNNNSSLKNKIFKSYSFDESKNLNEIKSTDINILLNRVKLNQKNEVMKKLYFSAAASTGLILFGFLIF